MAELPSVANLTSETMSVAYPLLRGQARFCGRTQGLSVGSLGRHPRGFRLQAGLRPTKPRPETATRAGRRCPVGALFRSREESTAGTTRGESLGPKWAASNGLWCQSGLAKIFIGPKVVHTGQAIAGRPYPATPIWRIQLWGEMAMKWSQAMCASTSSICCRCRPGPIRARAGTCLVSPWNRRSGRAFSRRTGGFPQSPSQPGPQSRKLMCHEAPDAAGAYGSISIFRA